VDDLVLLAIELRAQMVLRRPKFRPFLS